MRVWGDTAVVTALLWAQEPKTASRSSMVWLMTPMFGPRRVGGTRMVNPEIGYRRPPEREDTRSVDDGTAMYVRARTEGEEHGRRAHPRHYLAFVRVDLAPGARLGLRHRRVLGRTEPAEAGIHRDIVANLHASGQREGGGDPRSARREERPGDGCAEGLAAPGRGGVARRRRPVLDGHDGLHV